jgi:hypothetical protein
VKGRGTTESGGGGPSGSCPPSESSQNAGGRNTGRWYVERPGRWYVERPGRWEEIISGL